MFGSDTEGVRIELRGLTKQYPGQDAPAVDDVNLDIPAGELVVFVGPSGCGKTTTMKMINRLVEPTSGEIRIGGKDILSLHPDELRRHIGYAIQQVGLFPHMTIGQNIGLVPKLLGWPAARTAARVEELLSLVNLEPSLFHDRYPRQLSGGQQQRVGVARALAADPPVMLMDEPFGATDPITREHLQKEFVKLQRQLRKTIIFVTHDFEEAIKLGDRIAVLKERSHIAQYDTPANILAQPADAYVAGFIGEDATLKRLALLRVEDLPCAGPPNGAGLPPVVAGTSLREALDVMIAHGTDRCSTPSGVLTYAALCEAMRSGPGAVPQEEVVAGDR
ncbi:osmoprotectant transport system ATP-binding protein [Streptosporangium album]|uniref:ABC-type quaternary amine transporter n=1 Tax=Streptosporangium album TaxID=47479 RepID=A0A7W7WER1_9ACTN|nr:ATP-binding cassette domain-containing protein [Streptosporangium album]MBB4943725.1 osmoprotectant transport system ATP-binding protein [Streptosporangium album]